MGSIDVSRLIAFDFFEGLSSQDLAFIVTNCKELEVPSGSILIQQGQVGKDVYLMEEGSVKVYRGQADSPKVQAVLEAPAIVGEMALLDKERIRTSSVVALNNLRLLSVPIGTFLVFVGVYPSLKERLRRLVDSRS